MTWETATIANWITIIVGSGTITAALVGGLRYLKRVRIVILPDDEDD